MDYVWCNRIGFGLGFGVEERRKEERPLSHSDESRRTEVLSPILESCPAHAQFSRPDSFEIGDWLENSEFKRYERLKG